MSADPPESVEIIKGWLRFTESGGKPLPRYCKIIEFEHIPLKPASFELYTSDKAGESPIMQIDLESSATAASVDPSKFPSIFNLFPGKGKPEILLAASSGAEARTWLETIVDVISYQVEREEKIKAKAAKKAKKAKAKSGGEGSTPEQETPKVKAEDDKKVQATLPHPAHLSTFSSMFGVKATTASGFSPLGNAPPALSLDKGQQPVVSAAIPPPLQSASGPNKAALPPPPLSPPAGVSPQSPFPALALNSPQQAVQSPGLILLPPPPPIALLPPPPSVLSSPAAEDEAKKKAAKDAEIAAEKAASEAKAKADAVKAQQAEAEAAKVRLEAEREKAEREKVEHEKAEREKAEHEKAEHEKAEREKAEREKAEREKAEREVAAAAEAAALVKKALEDAEANRLVAAAAAEKAEAERKILADLAEKAAAEKALAEKALAEKALAEKALAEKALAEKALAEKAAAEKAEAEKAEALEKERIRLIEEETQKRAEEASLNAKATALALAASKRADDEAAAAAAASLVAAAATTTTTTKESANMVATTENNGDSTPLKVLLTSPVLLPPPPPLPSSSSLPPPAALLPPPALPPPSSSPQITTPLSPITMTASHSSSLPVITKEGEDASSNLSERKAEPALTPGVVLVQPAASLPATSETIAVTSVVVNPIETTEDGLVERNAEHHHLVENHERTSSVVDHPPVKAVNEILQSKLEEEERTLAELNALNERMEDKRKRASKMPQHEEDFASVSRSSPMPSPSSLSSNLTTPGPPGPFSSSISTSPGVGAEPASASGLTPSTDSIRVQLEQMAATVQFALSKLTVPTISPLSPPNANKMEDLVNEMSPLKNAVDMLQSALSILGVVAAQNNPAQLPISSSSSSSSPPPPHPSPPSSPPPSSSVLLEASPRNVSTLSPSPPRSSFSTLSPESSTVSSSSSRQQPRGRLQKGMNVAEFAKTVRERLQDLMNDISRANKELDSLSGTPLKPFQTARKAVLSASRSAALDELRTLRDVLNELNDGEHSALFAKHGTRGAVSSPSTKSSNRSGSITSGISVRPPWDPAVSKEQRSVSRAADVPSPRLRSKSRTSTSPNSIGATKTRTTATDAADNTTTGGRAVLMENRRHHQTGVTSSTKSPVPSPRQLAEATSAASILSAKNASLSRTGGRSRSSRSKSPSSTSPSSLTQTRTRSKSRGRALLEEALAGQANQRTYHLSTSSSSLAKSQEEEEQTYRATLVSKAMEAKAKEEGLL